MKTEEDVRKTQNLICNELMKGGLSQDQRCVLCGVISAFSWVLESKHPLNVVQGIIDGMPVPRAAHVPSAKDT